MMIGVSRSGNFFLKSATKLSFGHLLTTCRRATIQDRHAELRHSPRLWCNRPAVNKNHLARVGVSRRDAHGA